jgi:hypothetical protein
MPDLQSLKAMQLRETHYHMVRFAMTVHEKGDEGDLVVMATISTFDMEKVGLWRIWEKTTYQS